MERFLRNLKHFVIFLKYLRIKKRNKIIVQDMDTTLDYCIKHPVAISRFGDGEFRWILKIKNDSFQKVDGKLSDRLIEVLNSEEKNHMICIPDVFDGVSQYTAQNSMSWKEFIVEHYDQLCQLINDNHVFFDANMTRPYIDQRDKTKAKERFEKLKKIWKNKKLLVVEGELTKFGVNNDLLKEAKSVHRIICPSKNAFSEYEKILNITAEFYKKNEENIVLIALGPTATVLAFDLANKGIQAIDIGHTDIEYEWFKKQVKSRTPILGKYVNEIPEGRKVTIQPKNIAYSQEIITTIK